MFSRFASATGRKVARRSLTIETRPPKTLFQKWSRRGLFLAGAGLTIYLLDIWANDDWEHITDRFRTPLSPDERKDRPRVVILGSGTSCFCLCLV